MIRNGALPHGASVRRLQELRDERGSFTELYRGEWVAGHPAVQWNLIHTEPGVMRGMRVHPKHDDFLVVVDGLTLVGLRDLRRTSATFGATTLLELSSSELSVLTIPAGIAHGLYAPELSIVLIGVTRYHDPGDELPVRWDDPELGIPWPFSSARVSASDAAGHSLADVTEMVARRE